MNVILKFEFFVCRGVGRLCFVREAVGEHLVDLEVAALRRFSGGLVYLLEVAVEVRGRRMPREIDRLSIIDRNAVRLLVHGNALVWAIRQAVALSLLELGCCFETLDDVHLVVNLIFILSIFFCLHGDLLDVVRFRHVCFAEAVLAILILNLFRFLISYFEI